MRQVEVEFLDEYKRLDNLLKQKFMSDNGVTEYIDRMIENEFRVPLIVSNWSETLKALKHIRWIRNNIVHNDTSECTEEDIDTVIEFYDEVMSLEDPLTKLSIYNKNNNSNTNKEENYLYEKNSNNKSLILVFIVLVIVLVIGGIIINV